MMRQWLPSQSGIWLNASVAWRFSLSALHAAVLLAKQSDVIVTQTVFESQLAGDFPAVLNVCRASSHCGITNPSRSRRPFGLRLHSEETGIRRPLARSGIECTAFIQSAIWLAPTEKPRHEKPIPPYPATSSNVPPLFSYGNL